MDVQPRFVRSIFGQLAEHYDTLNRILSFWQDVSWRQFAVQKLLMKRGKRFLDAASGTCEMALALVKTDPAVRVVAIDFTFSMLTRGRTKILRASEIGRIHQALGDGLCLPFPEASFDGAIIAFGIRNMGDHDKALRELARIVVPGGTLVVLEFSVPQGLWFQPLYLFYLKRILPRIGGLLSRNRVAYEYLADSILGFPRPESFRKSMESAGFMAVNHWPLTFGVVGVYEGERMG